MFVFISVIISFLVFAALIDYLTALHAASATSAPVRVRPGRRGL